MLKKQILSTISAVTIFTSATLPVALAEDADTVHVTIENNTYTQADAAWSGVLLDNSNVELLEGDTIISVLSRVFEEEDISQTGLETNYITCVNGLATSADYMQGWMISFNDWFTSQGVENYFVSDGDYINLSYTCNMGADLGSSWSDTTTLLDTLQIVGDSLDTEFSSDTFEYSITLDENVNSISVIPAAKNKNYQTRIYKNAEVTYSEETGYSITGEEEYENILCGLESFSPLPETLDYYKRGQEINVSDGDVLTVACGLPYWNTMNAQGLGSVYTIKIKTPDEPLPEYSGDWTGFAPNTENMRKTNAQTPKKSNYAELLWGVNYSIDWTDSVTPPILVNDNLYLVKGDKVLILSKETGEVLAQSEALAVTPGYAMNPLTYGDGMIFVQIGKGRIQALRADTLESLWISEELGGQTNSPITYKNGYIYTGSWSGEDADGTYFCINTTDEDTSDSTEIKNCTWKLTHKGGFYWAGAYVTDNFAIFGSDDGEETFSDSAVLYSVNPQTGEEIDRISGISGDIRSSVSYDKDTDRLYFTTKKGVLYGVKINSDGTFNEDSMIMSELDGMITCTPIVHNNIIYLGISGSDAFGNSTHSLKAFVISDETFSVIASITTPGYIQSTPLLSYAYDDAVYIYATYNAQPGGIYVIKSEINADTVTLTGDNLFVPENDMAQYCICSPISDADGTIYYKNDSGYIMAIKNSGDELTITKDTAKAQLTSLYNKYSASDYSTTSWALLKRYYEDGMLNIESAQTPDAITAALEYTEAKMKEVPKTKTDTNTSSGSSSRPGTPNVTGSSSKAPQITTPQVIQSTVTFSDIKEHWAKSSIEKLASKGIIKGKSENVFAPDDNITRVEFLTMLFRISKDNTITYNNTFTDVTSDAWYKDTVAWAVNTGITNGTGDAKFSPNALITREEAAVFISRFISYKQYSLIQTETNSQFTDNSSVSEWAKTAVEYAKSTGIINGLDDGSFAPSGSATRAQTAQMLVNLIGKADIS